MFVEVLNILFVQLEIVESIVATSCTYDQYDDDIDKKAKEKEISKEIRLKDTLESLKKQQEMNEKMLIKYDIEHKEYNGKMESLINLQKKLYKAIIHQGVDSRYFKKKK